MDGRRDGMGGFARSSPLAGGSCMQADVGPSSYQPKTKVIKRVAPRCALLPRFVTFHTVIGKYDPTTSEIVRTDIVFVSGRLGGLSGCNERQQDKHIYKPGMSHSHRRWSSLEWARAAPAQVWLSFCNSA